MGGARAAHAHARAVRCGAHYGAQGRVLISGVRDDRETTRFAAVLSNIWRALAVTGKRCASCGRVRRARPLSVSGAASTGAAPRRTAGTLGRKLASDRRRVCSSAHTHYPLTRPFSAHEYLNTRTRIEKKRRAGAGARPPCEPDTPTSPSARIQVESSARSQITQHAGILRRIAWSWIMGDNLKSVKTTLATLLGEWLEISAPSTSCTFQGTDPLPAVLRKGQLNRHTRYCDLLNVNVIAFLPFTVILEA